jgi:hypothetical protein
LISCKNSKRKKIEKEFVKNRLRQRNFIKNKKQRSNKNANKIKRCLKLKKIIIFKKREQE